MLGILLLATAPAWAVTLTFDELPFQPVDGLNFQGVTFGFTIGGSPSSDANYNSTGPGIITFVQDPSLEGNAAGILTLDFSVPTPNLSFGVALLSTDPLTPGFSVHLFGPGLVPLGDFPVDTSPLINFSEAFFSFSSSLVSRAVLDGDSGVARFALDNLTFTPVPVPGSLILSASGLLGLIVMRLRKLS